MRARCDKRPCIAHRERCVALAVNGRKYLHSSRHRLENSSVFHLHYRFFRFAEGYEPSLVEHGEHVRHRQRFLKAMLGQNNGQAEILAHFAQSAEKIGRRNGVELTCRLIEDEHIRPQHGSGRKVYQLLLTSG